MATRGAAAALTPDLSPLPSQLQANRVQVGQDQVQGGPSRCQIAAAPPHPKRTVETAAGPTASHTASAFTGCLH
eukprot:1598362-Prymnesium_polylepis.1